ncbi:MAG: LacI family DNA-binding transcriptional regulator [Spirochaetes bacterium]|nr:LacI family DNA-binding transcriptional regulator [Spirochaetota bacterium]
MARSAIRPPTLKDIAAEAGVSIVAASVALNPSARSRAKVGAATRRKVLRIAEKLHYKPNMFASALRQRGAGRIGFAADRFDDLANNELKHRVLRLGIQRKVAMTFLNFDAYSTAASMLRDMLSYDFDKLILFRFWDRMNAGERAALAERFGERLLVLDVRSERDRARYGVSFLSMDFDLAWGQIFAHAAEAGYRRAAVLTYLLPPGLPGTKVFVSPQEERLKQLSRAHGAGFFDHRRDVFRADLGSPKAVYVATRALLERGVDFIKIHHDQIAPMVYRAVRDAGKRIPQEVGIAGFDDLYFAEYLDPPLTTVRNDFGAYAKSIFDWLEEPRPTVLIPHELLVRGSTRRR